MYAETFLKSLSFTVLAVHTWDALWEALPEAYGCIRYDLRDVGGSTATNSDRFHHPDDLNDPLDTLGINRCHLVGVSMGGSIALNFALRQPERVSSLSLLSPGLTGWEWSDEWRMLWLSIAQAARAGNMHSARELWFNHPLFDSTRETAVALKLRSEIARFPGMQWIHIRASAISKLF